MAVAEDPVTSIPIHASTLRMLQRLKTGDLNWDEFLRGFLEDWMPPNLERELDQRSRTGRIIPGKELKRRHEELRQRGR